MSILGNLFFRGGAEKQLDIPKLIAEGAMVVDTRTANEFAGGHIEGSINIPHDIIGTVIGNHESDKSRSIIVYCQAGVRAASAKKSLEAAGYSHVVNGGGLHHMQQALGK